jgi:hypothetical protein
MTCKNVNLRELCEFEFCGERVRSVLGRNEMVARGRHKRPRGK